MQPIFTASADTSGVAVPLTWFRSPQGTDPGTTNLCYVALDHRVITGDATAPAVIVPSPADRPTEAAAQPLDVAQFLEQVAVLAGAFRGFGVVPGVSVGIDLDDPFDELCALLATLRLGAVAHRGRVPGAHLWVTDRPVRLPEVEADPDEADPEQLPGAAVLRHTQPVDPDREIEWDMAVRAGRTDPAPVADVAGDSVAYVPSVGGQSGGSGVLVRDVLEADDPWGRIITALTAGEVPDLSAPVLPGAGAV